MYMQKVNNKWYVAPQVKVVSFRIERGFAGSGPEKICSHDDMFMLVNDQNASDRSLETFSHIDATNIFQ